MEDTKRLLESGQATWTSQVSKQQKEISSLRDGLAAALKAGKEEEEAHKKSKARMSELQSIVDSREAALVAQTDIAVMEARKFNVGGLWVMDCVCGWRGCSRCYGMRITNGYLAMVCMTNMISLFFES